jgi:prepilin signal peptidase PulO-like enzyme (type II secretory pathway)
MSTGKIVKMPIFWLGTAVIVFAYFSADNTQAQSGVKNALTIAAVGAGAAAIIYALRTAPATAPA